MTNKIETFGKRIYEWLSQFAPTYRGVLPTQGIPEDVYIRMDGYFDNFASWFIFPVVLYQRKSTSVIEIVRLADKIESAIGDGGICIGDNSMMIHIQKGSPFYQDRTDEDETTKSGYINLQIAIYAVSAPTMYQVEYLSDNYVGSLYPIEHREAGDMFVLPENKYVKMYYRFGGWNDGEQVYGAGDTYTMPAKDVYFHVAWEAIEYLVNFYADNRFVDSRTYTIENPDVTPPPVPNKDGYVGYWEPFELTPIVEEDIRVDAIYVVRNKKYYAGTFYAGNALKFRRGN